jgi:hypothetical protein
MANACRDTHEHFTFLTCPAPRRPPPGCAYRALQPAWCRAAPIDKPSVAFAILLGAIFLGETYPLTITGFDRNRPKNYAFQSNFPNDARLGAAATENRRIIAGTRCN